MCIRDRADAEPLVHFGVDIHRHSAAEHQCVQHAAVHVAGQDDLCLLYTSFQRIGVQKCIPMVYAPQLADAARTVEQCFRKSGFSAVHVCQNLSLIHI